jgi:hypothetical protein
MKAILLTCLLLTTLSCVAQTNCNCETPYEQNNYIKALKATLETTCNGCEVSNNEVLLVYNAKCRSFAFSENGIEGLQFVNDLSKVKLHYKKPFIFKVINLNRYLYNVNLGNSDVAFTSTEPAIMQQYLIPGSTNGQITPANTYVNGGSSNSGDNIFNIIQGFKPNIDKILINVEALEQMLRENDVNKSIYSAYQAVSNASKNFTIYSKKIDSPFSIPRFRDYPNTLDSLGNNVHQLYDQIQKATPSDNSKQDNLNDLYSHFSDAFNQYKDSAKAFIIQADAINKGYASTSPSDSSYKQFEKSVLEMNNNGLKAALEESRKDTLIIEEQDTSQEAKTKNMVSDLKKYKKKLNTSIDTLEAYYNNMLDNKIKAYSICTEDFPCCSAKDDKYNYTYFDNLLSNITNQYLDFRKMASKINKAQNDSADARALRQKPKTGTSTPHPQTTLVNYTATTSDLIFQNGKLTGVTLHQSPDTSKSKTSPTKDSLTAAIAAMDSLWFAFEKSISPDFMMREILFVRNMVQDNMTYTSPPIFPYGDRMGLLFQIVASDSAKKNGVVLDNITTESLDFPVMGRSLFSFGAGTFAGFGRSLKSPTYQFQQIPTPGTTTVQSTSPYQLVKTGNGAAPIGLDGLANVTWRVNMLKKSDFRVGLSAGVGAVVTPNIQVSYLLGGTFSIGTYQQFHLTGGITGTNVNVLKDYYSTNPNIYYTNAPTDGVYKQQIKTGFFLSISYTLFTLKASAPTQNTLATTTAQPTK